MYQILFKVKINNQKNKNLHNKMKIMALGGCLVMFFILYLMTGEI